MTLNRRTFLGLAAGGAATGAVAWAGLLRDSVDERGPAKGAAGASSTTAGSPGTSGPARAAGGDDRVLVVLQLGGGNDGLNTLVPTAGAYRDARPRLAVAEKALVALAGENRFALHPSLAPLKTPWEHGRLAAMEAIGFEHNSRSHFQALDWWWSGTPGRSSTTGWLGRWLDATAPDQANPLRAVAIGSGSPALRAERSMVTAIEDPARFLLEAPAGVDDDTLLQAFLACATPLGAEPLVAAAQRSIPDAVFSAQRLATAGVVGASVPSGKGRPQGGAAAGDVATGLDLAARLIKEELGTRVIVVGAGGFDTHAGQAPQQERLLADVATGIDQFLAALDEAGQADRVLLVTTSEFGRRVAENGSGGTDHGNAGVQFLAGAGLARAQVVGDADLAHLDDQGDLRPTIDVRSLYAVGLTWLGGPVAEVLGGTYDTHGLLAA